ncbi:MAG TPA: Uma2 family endonuclease [Bryobacteraceae bacterium]|jgi:Uma2 family endonuclease|nr:Uma2 family endonuclease [Bryobacteraceae bacterium]
MASLPKPPLTEDEYLRLDRKAETKSEFHDGQMFAMAGGSLNHSLLANSIGALLRGQVAAGCRVFNADLRIKIPASKTYTYADCSVICGEPEFSGDQQDVVLNPVLIVEVLSPTTEGYDRGKKFELYRTIRSFREYLLVHQDRRRIEHYSRQDDGSWLLREHSGTEGSVAVDVLGVHISLSDLYATAINCD